MRTHADPKPGLSLLTRAGTDDDGIIHEVVELDAYRAGDMRNKVVIDCGADIGSFSCFAAWGGARAVYAVEPNPGNLEILRQNIRNWPRITLIEAAIGATDEPTVVYGEGGQSHTTRLTGNDEPGTPVERTTLPALFERFDLTGVDMLKADCEGGEMEMIVGTPHEYLARIRRIAMEWHGSIFFGGAMPVSIGSVVEHLLHTHHVEVGGLPDQWGMLHATRLGA